MNEIYSMYDSKADFYMPFFCERNHMTAIRAVEAAMQPDHPIYKNAEDYSLFHIGTWDQEKGKIMSFGPEHITDCWVLRARINNQKATEQE